LTGETLGALADALDGEHVVLAIGAGIDGAIEQRGAAAENDDFLVVDQVPRSLGGDLRIGLVVGDRILDLAAIDAAGLVELVEHRLGRLWRVGEIDDAGHRRNRADLDRTALAGRSGKRRARGQRERRCGAGKRQQSGLIHSRSLSCFAARFLAHGAPGLMPDERHGLRNRF
jgi:hypothetical protein